MFQIILVGFEDVSQLDNVNHCQIVDVLHDGHIDFEHIGENLLDVGQNVLGDNVRDLGEMLGAQGDQLIGGLVQLGVNFAQCCDNGAEDLSPVKERSHRINFCRFLYRSVCNFQHHLNKYLQHFRHLLNGLVRDQFLLEFEQLLFVIFSGGFEIGHGLLGSLTEILDFVTQGLLVVFGQSFQGFQEMGVLFLCFSLKVAEF